MDGIDPPPLRPHRVVTEERHEGEKFVETTRCWVTNPRAHPFHVEYLRYEPDTPVEGPVGTNRTSRIASTMSTPRSRDTRWYSGRSTSQTASCGSHG